MHLRKNICLQFILIFSIVLFLITPVSGNEKIVTAKVHVSESEIVPGQEVTLKMSVSVEKGWHINAHKPLQDFLIPTIMSLVDSKGVELKSVSYPKPESVNLAFLETTIVVYGGTFTIEAQLAVSPDLVPGPQIVRCQLEFQGCNDKTCVPPDTITIDVPFKIKEKGPALMQEGAPSRDTSTSPPVTTKEPESSPHASTSSSDDLTSYEQEAKTKLEHGIFFAIISFFLAGLSLNLTPCVYPVIPITISFFGSQGDSRGGSRFGTALAYTMGIAMIFTLLGLVSSLAGKQWGFLFQNPWFIVVLALILFAMAASMFGAFEIRIPMSIMNKFGQSREGILGAFIMGLTVGVVIAPCAAGFIIGLVGLVAKEGLVLRGTILFFFMGLGLGLPYLFLVAFSSLLGKIPQSGMWMVWIRKFFGIVLIAVAFYFILPQASRLSDQMSFYLGLVGIFGGLFLGFLDQHHGYSKNFNRGRALFGILVMLVGGYFVQEAISKGSLHDFKAKDSPIAWIYYHQQDMADITAPKKPIIFDFYADWCAPCKAMDKKTFTNNEIVDKAKKFTMVKVDCTKVTPHVKKLMTKYKVAGMPTLIFLDKNGKKQPHLRAGEFVGPKEFLEKMNQVQP